VYSAAPVYVEGTGNYDMENEQFSTPDNGLSFRQEVKHKSNKLPNKPFIHLLDVILHEPSRNIQV
jgi:hypothetical protein